MEFRLDLHLIGKTINPMKKKNLLSVPEPCSQKWSSFTTTAQGGFCPLCTKLVVDFTKKSTEEILSYVAQQSNHVCGRFRKHQIVQPNLTVVKPGWKLFGASLLLFSVSALGSPTFANPILEKLIIETSIQQVNPVISNCTVRGIVRDEEQAVLAGANVYLQGTEVGTVTDENGKFEFPQKLKEGDVLIFSFVGLETQQYVVPPNAPDVIEIQIAMPYAIMMGAVEVENVFVKQPGSLNRFWKKVKSIF
jgi:hypothetical protein